MHPSNMPLVMTRDELNTFLDEHFPESKAIETHFEVLEPGFLRVRHPFHPRNLRPGGTISGPTLMTLADFGAYCLILAMIGPVALAVTTNLNINFMKKPSPGDMMADIRLLKLGKRLAVAEVSMYSEGVEDLAAHATVTYSIPPR